MKTKVSMRLLQKDGGPKVTTCGECGKCSNHISTSHENQITQWFAHAGNQHEIEDILTKITIPYHEEVYQLFLAINALSLTPGQVFQSASLISMREVDAVLPDGKLPDTVILTAERRDGYSVRRHQIHRQNHRNWRYGPTSNQGISIIIPLPLVPQVTAMIRKYEREQEAQQLSSSEILSHFSSPQAPTSSPAPHSTQKPQFQMAPSSSQASAPSQALVPYAAPSLHSSPAPPSSSQSPVGSGWSWNEPNSSFELGDDDL